MKRVWTQFENFFNKIINLIIHCICWCYQKLVPDKIKAKIIECIKLAKIILDKKSKIIFDYYQKVKPQINSRLDRIKTPLKNTNNVISLIINSFNSFNIRTIDYKKHFLTLSNFINVKTTPLVQRLKKKIAHLGMTTIFISFICISMLLLVILKVILSGRTLYYGAKYEGRGPTPTTTAKRKPEIRPSYFRRILPAKQLNIYEVTLPIYIETINSVRTLLIDITLETSNRYTRQFFYKNSYLIKDRLNKAVHPIIPNFPLTKEGKTIIKDKIKREINDLIIELEFEGKIKEVHFVTVIAA